LTYVRPDLYSAADLFSWTGGYSDAARARAAVDLLDWVTQRNLNGLDLVSHSHGGSVAMVATNGGLDIGELVLLSCPAHIPKYVPSFSRVGKIVSVHVHMDLVILADGGGQRFNIPQIQEHVLPIWFDHSATHEPNVWQQYKIPQWL
jgi:pimeloyl-ACP methyl ester carboxylesterase